MWRFHCFFVLNFIFQLYVVSGEFFRFLLEMLASNQTHAPSSLQSRHLLYLQLRKNVLEQQVLCTEDDLITLGGLALQAEVGDFKDTVRNVLCENLNFPLSFFQFQMRQLDYFTITHYIPENVSPKQKELAKYLRSAHFCKKGLLSSEAEQNFIRYLQELKEYGMHLYSATWVSTKTPLFLIYW